MVAGERRRPAASNTGARSWDFLPIAQRTEPACLPALPYPRSRPRTRFAAAKRKPAARQPDSRLSSVAKACHERQGTPAFVRQREHGRPVSILRCVARTSLLQLPCPHRPAPAHVTCGNAAPSPAAGTPCAARAYMGRRQIERVEGQHHDRRGVDRCGCQRSDLWRRQCEPPVGSHTHSGRHLAAPRGAGAAAVGILESDEARRGPVLDGSAVSQHPP